MENKNIMENELAAVAGGASDGGKYHVVRENDTSGSICVRYNITAQELYGMNPGARTLKPGDVVRVG